jgi:hypothetical protein
MEFGWQLPAIPLPPGSLSLIIEIGDKEDQIHTSRTFVYNIKSVMAATNIVVPNDLTLSSILEVKMTPALLSNNEYVAFRSEKFFDGELVDAAGEIFTPPTSADTHRYSMRVKVGGIVVKIAEGDVSVGDDGILIVQFESSIDENLDFGTGFSIDFQFETDKGTPVPLVIEQEIFVSVKSRLIAEGEALPLGAASYGATLRTSFKLKDEDSGRYLTAGHAYPVFVVLAKQSRYVLSEKRCKYQNDEFVSHLEIGASVPSGAAVVAVMIRKGHDLIPVLTQFGSPFESDITVAGDLVFSGKVREAGKFVVVDFNAKVNESKLKGTALCCRIVDSNKGVVADIDLAQKKKGSRLSWELGSGKGSYFLELRRLNAPDDKPLYMKEVKIEHSLKSVLEELPIPGLICILSFVCFAWSIFLRKGVESH